MKKKPFDVRYFLFFLILIFTAPIMGANTPEKLGANLAKINKTDFKVKLVNKVKQLHKAGDVFGKDFQTASGIGQTFEEIPFDESKNIKKFNRSVSNTFFKRDLFGFPEYTASYYYAKYDQKSVFVESIYLQIISDSRWNRLLYGSLNGSLKTYNDILGPGQIVINPFGQVFVAEKGKSRILVFNINHKENDLKFELSYTIENINDPTSLAYNDGGTAFDISDDFLFVADASQNTITKWLVRDQSAQLSKVFKGFQWPVSISCGRWNGVNTNHLYVIDSYAKKITLYENVNDELEELQYVGAKNNQTFSKIEIDHFGQLYLSDAVNGEIFKLTADLDILASKKLLQNSGINDLSIPFGTIEIEGDGKYWAGFDQLFAVQTWNDDSGVERFRLGLSLQDQNVSISEHNEILKTDFKITDFAESRISIYSADNKKIFESDQEWLASGKNFYTWDRLDKNGEQVKAGYYKLDLQLKSAYQQEPLIQRSAFYLPTYYHIDCGNEDDTKEIKRLRGESKKLQDHFYIEDKEALQYKISGLNPNSNYQVSAHYFGLEYNNSQQLLIDDISVHDFIEIKKEGVKTGYYDIPKTSFSDGEIVITIESDNSPVAVSDIWLKETGKNFGLQEISQEIPSTFKLEQNYPNPFNPATVISYHLPNAGNVDLVVYDMLGRKVKSLVNGFQDAGVYRSKFDGSGLASGLYFYQLKTGQILETRKMLLVK